MTKLVDAIYDWLETKILDPVGEAMYLVGGVVAILGVLLTTPIWLPFWLIGKAKQMYYARRTS